MTSLATQLRNAVLGVLVAQSSIDELTDEDYAFLNVVSTYGQARMLGGTGPAADDVLTKMQADRRELARTPLSGGIGAAAPMPQAATLDTSEQQAALPLGTADRGPEPQTIAQTLDTSPPVGEVNQMEQPPDYTRLAT